MTNDTETANAVKRPCPFARTIIAAAYLEAGHPLTDTQADFMGCLIAALFTALPDVLNNLLGCMAGPSNGGGTTTYNPGDRTRCP